MPKISKKEWREFEQLVFQILLDEYNVQENDINKLTSETKDGGYDGIFYVSSNKDDEANLDSKMFQILFEAKLRASYSKDLPLQEFSKALIIAVNKNADRIVIATNLHFSDKTRYELENYAHNTGLSIQLKTSESIFAWIENHSDLKINKKNFELYKLLEKSYKEEKNNFFDENKTNIFNEFVEAPHQEIIGCIRKDEQDHAKICIENHNGVLTIEGEAGVGKTVFLNSLLSKLANDGYTNYVFDLKSSATPRVLFVNMICSIWNLNCYAFCSMSKDEMKDTLCFLGDERIDEQMNRIITNVLLDSEDEYNSHSDIYEFNLINYMYKLYSVRKCKKKIVLAFKNLSDASIELINFLLSLCRKLGDNFPIILELRTSSQGNERISCNDWEKALENIVRLPNITKRSIIKYWDNTVTANYIHSKFKPYSVTMQDCYVIMKKIGKNPLYIDAYVDFLKLKLDGKIVLLNNLTSFVKNHHVNYFNNILFNYISSSVSCSDHGMEICFALSVFDGSVSFDILESLFGNEYKSKIKQFLKQAKFISTSGDKLIIMHSLYLDCLKEYCESLSLVWQQELAEKILSLKAVKEQKNNEYLETKILLLRITGNMYQFILESIHYANKLFLQGQFNKCFEYFKSAYNLLYDLPESQTLPHDIEFQCRCGYLSVKLKLINYQNSDMDFLAELHQCQVFLKYRFINHTANDEICLDLIEYRYYHLLGDFTKTLELANEMVKKIDKGNVSSKYASKALCEYCIAVKETSSLDLALKEYRRAMQKYPDSYELRFSRLSHLASKYGAISPKSTMIFLKLCSDIEPYLSLADRFHNHVNILACLFLDKKYSEAKDYGDKLLNELYVYGIRSEEGRAANNLGCINLALGYDKEAEKLLDYGISIFSGGKYVAFLWPLLINRISLSIFRKKNDEVDQYAQKSFDIFSHAYLERIKHFTFNRNYIDKLFVGIAILCLYYKNKNQNKKIDELTATINNPALNKTLLPITNYKELVEMLNGTIYVHNNMVLVKD